MSERDPGAPVSPDADPAPSDQASRTARGAVWLALNGIVVKGSQTAVLLILAALLAPSALGLVALGTLVVNTTSMVAGLGTASALVFWRGDVARAARTALTIGLGLGSALTALVWLVAPWLADVLRASDGGAEVIRGLSLVIPCAAVSAVTNEVLRRRLAFLRRIIPDTTSAVVGAAVAVVLALGGMGVMALVVGQLVQAGLTVLLSWCVLPPVLPGWHTDDARGLLAYGAPFSAAGLLEVVQLNLDYVVVSAVLGAYALGQYSLAFRVAFMPYLMVVVVITGAAFPYLCRLRGVELGRAVVTLTQATVTLVAPLCLGLWLFRDDLVLLGVRWAAAVPVLGWLALYALLLSVGLLVQTSLNAAGRPSLAMGLRVAQLGLLALGLVVVADRGITVVAVVQVLAAGLTAAVALALAVRTFDGFSLLALARSLLPALVGAAVMAAVALALREVLHVPDTSLPGLLVLGPLALVVYAAVVLLLDRQGPRTVVALLRGAS